MTKSNILSPMTFRRLNILLIVLILVLIVSCGRKNSQDLNQIDYQSEWWNPILQKHQIDMNQFDYKVTFTCIDTNNVTINKWLELGNDNGSDEKYLKLKDAIIIVMFDTTKIKSPKQNYWILSSPIIFQDLERKTIDYDWGKQVWYDITDKDIIPLDSMGSYGKFDFNFGLKIAPASFRQLTP